MPTFVRKNGKLVNAAVAEKPEVKFDHNDMHQLFQAALHILKTNKDSRPCRCEANDVYNLYRGAASSLMRHRSMNGSVYYDDKLADLIHDIWAYLSGHTTYLSEQLKEFIDA